MEVVGNRVADVYKAQKLYMLLPMCPLRAVSASMNPTVGEPSQQVRRVYKGFWIGGRFV